MPRDASFWIETLGLSRHPEGGHYRETYRSPGAIPARGGFPAGRSFSTAIYYLLCSDEVSRLHRLRSDEIFHFYHGSAMSLHVIDPAGDYASVALGDDPRRGQSPQASVAAGSWFGATVDRPDSFALVGCTVAPGFEFGDFELADRVRLLDRFPRHRAIIERLT